MSKCKNVKYILVVALLMFFEILSGPALSARARQAPANSDLFQDTLFYGDKDRFLNPEIVRTRFVKVNFDGFNALELNLNLFGGVFFRARLKQRGKVGSVETWVGRIENIPHGQAIFTFKDNVLSGNIEVPGAYYLVRYAAEGIHAVHELDHSKFPDCALSQQDGQQELHHSIDPGIAPNVSPDSGLNVNPDSGLNVSPDSGSSIDVLVLYNAAARSGAGGTTAMETAVAQIITNSNTSYSNSGIIQRLNLVHATEVNYIESGSIFTDLSRLRGTSDGFIDHIHTMRNTYGADVVALITEDGGGYCGVASLMTTVTNSFKTSAFSVTKRTCADSNYSFAHELGHNMGARHDRYVDNTDNSPYAYNHGFVSLPGDWRTIMAYNTDCDDNGDGYCVRLGYWSNPAVTYSGLAMGIADGDPSAADNHLTLNNTANTVANFRSHVSTPGITVTSPNGGESLTGNAAKTITWSSSGSFSNVKIEYSLNNGSSWSTITTSTPDDGSYSWTVVNSSSSQCLIKISEAVAGSPADTSNANFSITALTSPTLTVTSPNGGESLTGAASHTITWSSTGSVGNVELEYSPDNGSSWTTIIASTTNDGSYAWTVPDNTAAQCLIKISEAADGDPTDTSDATFSITSTTIDSIRVTSPDGGENLTGGSSYPITWSSTGAVGNVMLEYSTDTLKTWTTIVSSTGNSGSYNWTVPLINSTNCYVRVSQVSGGTPTDTSNHKFSIVYSTPEILLSRSVLDFGADTSGIVTDPQFILISNSGGGTLNWNVSTSTSWLSVSPGSVSQAGKLVISADINALAVGTYTGTLTISDPGASNSPQQVSVGLVVYPAGSTSPPTGDFSTPDHGSTVMSSIPVTGWVIDDIGVSSVKIYNGTSFVGDAVFVEGARTDVEQSYPGFPANYKAGWGYMMLSNFLPNGGNGSYTLYAKATDAEGNEVTLGSKTITINNAGAVKPFGAIDTPAQGGTASGSSFVNWGWVLTPQPNSIPTDGSTINVWVDGVNLGNPTYNIYREDIATLFPGYANSSGAVGYFYLDTGTYENGVHIIQWTAKDNAGNTDGIGSRYFSIENTSNRTTAFAKKNRGAAFTSNKKHTIHKGTVLLKRGYNRIQAPNSIEPDGKGAITVQIREMERLELQLLPKFKNSSSVSLSTRIPGVHLDRETGLFCWQPGVGFIGDYEFLFLINRNGLQTQLKVNVKIKPKY